MGIKFTYPKPVDLVAYLIEAFTSDDDLILTRLQEVAQQGMRY